MSITKDECACILADCANRKAMTSGNTAANAAEMQDAVNAALAAGVQWKDLFLKAMQIVTIITGPGSYADKLAAILALFALTPPVPGPTMP